MQVETVLLTMGQNPDGKDWAMVEVYENQVAEHKILRKEKLAYTHLYMFLAAEEYD